MPCTVCAKRSMLMTTKKAGRDAHSTHTAGKVAQVRPLRRGSGWVWVVTQNTTASHSSSCAAQSILSTHTTHGLLRSDLMICTQDSSPASQGGRQPGTQAAASIHRTAKGTHTIAVFPAIQPIRRVVRRWHSTPHTSTRASLPPSLPSFRPKKEAILMSSIYQASRLSTSERQTDRRNAHT